MNCQCRRRRRYVCLAKQTGLLVGEMRLRMDQSNDSRCAMHVLPGLFHEAAVEVWLQSRQVADKPVAEPRYSIVTTTSVVPSMTRSRIPGSARVASRFALRAASLGLRASCHQGRPRRAVRPRLFVAAPTAGCRLGGRSRRGRRPWRSRVPSGRSPAVRRPFSQTLSHGWSSSTSSTSTAPAKSRLSVLGVVQVVPVRGRRPACVMPLLFFRASGSRPRSCWHASIHWSSVGGTAPSVSVSGQNHSAAQASMTRRSRW